MFLEIAVNLSISILMLGVGFVSAALAHKLLRLPESLFNVILFTPAALVWLVGINDSQRLLDFQGCQKSLCIVGVIGFEVIWGAWILTIPEGVRLTLGIS